MVSLMKARHRWLIGALVIGTAVFGGCKRSGEVTSSSTATSDAVHKVRTEESWMVQQVSQFVVDMSRLQKPADFHLEAVTVRKVTGNDDTVNYEVSAGELKSMVPLEAGVWNPASYASLARTVFTTPDTTVPDVSDLDYAQRLLSPDLKNLLEENTRLSDFLTAHPASAGGHVQAALLTGTLALNDFSGDFRDLRILLNRMVAHLATADALGIPSAEKGRRLAETLRLTLCGQQADALRALQEFQPGQNKTVDEWLEILRLRNTGDWRQGHAQALAGSDALKHEYFRALIRSVNAAKGLEFLKEAKAKPDVSYWRVANEESLSVGHGHVFTKPILGLEFSECSRGAEAFGIKPEQGSFDWLKLYVDTPEGSPVVNESGKGRLQVLGQNLLAGYHQRHLMQAAQRLFGFLNDNWGVREKAKELEAFINDQLPDLRYMPFLKRMIARKNSVRETRNVPCTVLIRERPELVTPTLWDSLRNDEDKERVLPVLDHHAWFNPEVPRGTAFEVDPRLHEIGVGDENNTTWMRQLWERAPYVYRLARYNASQENGGTTENISPQVLAKWLGPMMDYDLGGMRLLAFAQKAQPDLFQSAMEKAAVLDPNCYLELGDYLEERGVEDAAARAYLQAFQQATDRVYMANSCLFLVRYLYAKGDQAMATKVAEEAADVFSYSGLEAYIWLLEQQGKWKEALETSRKVDNRYNDDLPVSEAACLVHLFA
ncbi:MAG: hypothetical protein K0R17_3349, partial [Rariglobus sp.]|nr:hypothetical protein [Rariglobus sp.]